MKYINYTIDIFLIGYFLYFFLFVILGLFTSENEEEQDPENKFAVIIPAHNEEKVIGQLLKNIKNLDYPRSLYDIFVVADNCEDKTAQIAEKHGVTVFTRRNQQKKGKGYALKFAFENLGLINQDTPNDQYDAVTVFDADNLVEENFFKAMNNRLMNGEEIIQAYLDSKNASDNWVTGTFSMMFWINDRYNLLSRYNIGLSAVLMGTGMCISTDTLNRIGWDTETLTEDLEYSIQALGQGTKTAFARETQIYDEKPTSFMASCRQRLRWARGQLSVVYKYVPGLIWKGIKSKNISMIDGGVRLFQQPFIMFYTVTTLLRIIFPETFYSPLFYVIINNLNTLGYIFPFMPYLLPSSVYFLDELSFKSYKYVLLFPVFMYSWVAILYWALLTINKESWIPTEHFRNISKEEVVDEKAA